MVFAATFQLNDTDRRLLIAAIIVLTLLFIVFALIGALIRTITLGMGKRIDQDVADAVRYRIIQNEKHFRKYARIKNARRFTKQATIPILILLASLLFYLIYAGVTGEWTRNYWKEFGTLFYQWDFANEENYAIVWGVKILAKWPSLSNTPHFVGSYYPSYILCVLWIVGGIWLFLVSQAYFARAIFIDRRARSVYKKSLDDYNHYENIYPESGKANPVNLRKQKSEEDKSSSPN